MRDVFRYSNRGHRSSMLKPVITLAFLLSLADAAWAQNLTVNPGRFGAMTCQQLWYTEQEVLAEGRVCLKSERARRAFRRAPRCISDDETILPAKVEAYLEQLRAAARTKGCRGF